jgi:hypothetical protein
MSSLNPFAARRERQEQKIKDRLGELEQQQQMAAPPVDGQLPQVELPASTAK